MSIVNYTEFVLALNATVAELENNISFGDIALSLQFWCVLLPVLLAICACCGGGCQ